MMPTSGENGSIPGVAGPVHDVHVPDAPPVSTVTQPVPVSDVPVQGDVQHFSPKGVQQRVMPNGSRLNIGGTPGNRGGGDTPKKIREALREMTTDNIKILREIAEDVTATKAMRMKAVDMMLKYGVGVAQTILDDDGHAVTPRVNIVEQDEDTSLGHPDVEEPKMLTSGAEDDAEVLDVYEDDGRSDTK